MLLVVAIGSFSTLAPVIPINLTPVKPAAKLLLIAAASSQSQA